MTTKRWSPLVLLGILVGVVLSTSVTAHAVSYSLTSAVRMRNEPTAASAYSAVAPTGSAISLNCQKWGEAQGPNGNTLC